MLSKSISKSDLKPQLLYYLRLIEKGASLVVTDHGRPVAKIIPFKVSKSRNKKPLKGSVLKYVDPTDPVGLDDWALS